VEQGQSSVERLAVEEVEEAPPKPRKTAEVVVMPMQQGAPTVSPLPFPVAPAQIQEPPLVSTAAPTPPPGPTIPTAPSGLSEPRPSPVLAALKVIARILAVRLILLLSVLGGFVLGVMAMLAQTWPSLAILVAYALLTVLPMVWLEVGQRPKGD
jgi:hypothetical protein